MCTKSVKWLTVGDRLAEDISTGNDILKKGTSLSFKQILSIQSSGIRYVKVETPFDEWEETDSIETDFPENPVEVLFAKEIFYEFIFTKAKKGRFHNLLDSKSDFLFLEDLFIYIMGNEAAKNMLFALKIWDRYSYDHSMDVFIIGSLWLNHLKASKLETFSTGFLMHDIGKIKVPRDILLKNGKLTREEFEIVKNHTIHGENILNQLGFSEIPRQLAKYHHIRMDQTGYPEPIPDSIPWEVQALMIIDVFSALTLDRPYRKAFSINEAIDLLWFEREKFNDRLLKNFIRFISEKETSIRELR